MAIIVFDPIVVEEPEIGLSEYSGFVEKPGFYLEGI
ncbi:hypothetical protein PAM7971_01644 [Pacificibacter marinus]|uniref:Uncharacterized protein n=1 Tax=Pacificibacter marinus TaxID=658057 RepID=A0A1Y5SCL3_9RHOB|nr:hypothetical protein PAM7971_01644 [Pacificibacter marinus]